VFALELEIINKPISLSARYVTMQIHLLQLKSKISILPSTCTYGIMGMKCRVKHKADDITKIRAHDVRAKGKLNLSHALTHTVYIFHKAHHKDRTLACGSEQ
jgi:hypothetical protein